MQPQRKTLLWLFTSFHRFPMPSSTGSLRARVWAQYCFPNDDFTSVESLVKLHKQHKMICSNHFDESAFTSSAKTRMNKFAIPSEAQNILAQLRDEQLSEEARKTECQQITQMRVDEEVAASSPQFSTSIEHLNELNVQSTDLVQPILQEQSEMSDSPVLSPENCDQNEHMSEPEPTTNSFCICCFQSRGPYVDLQTCSHADFLNNFEMPELKPEYQLICYLCHNMLKKIKVFKLQVEESFKLLSAVTNKDTDSDSVVNITKSSQQSHNLENQFVFAIDIRSTRKKRKLQANRRRNPQTKRKKTKADIDNLKTDEISKRNNTDEPQTITQQAKADIENSFIPKVDKKTKNIENALKIININQNSGCIDLLATSLKTISYSLLSNINNFNIGNNIGNTTDILFNNTNNASSTSISSDNITINNTTTENNSTNLVVENQMDATTDNIFFSNSTPISSDNNTNTEMNNTNLEIGSIINLNSANILSPINMLHATKTTPISSDDIIIHYTTDSNEIKAKDRYKTENAVLVENITNEELDSLDQVESTKGGQSNMHTEGPVMKRPPITSKIRQVTLTREQLIEERSKTVTSQAYLRLPHRCESCLIGFQFRENLDDHVLRKHTEDKVRNPKQCDVCLQFVEACDYDKHFLWHLTRYECSSCSQQFACYEKAAQHYKKLHCGAKPRALFKCPQCPFKTQHMYRLNRHIRRVTKCKSCGDRIAYGCGTGITLNKHRSRCKGSRSRTETS